MLQHLEHPPKLRATSSVIWLHGLGADGHDFAPIASELDLPSQLQPRFLFPHAPERPVTVNGGMRMRAWYDISSRDIGHEPDRFGIDQSLKEIELLVDRELERGIRADQIMIAGFSQGGVLATECLLTFPEKIGGSISLSAYLPRAPESVPRAKGTKRLFMGHGRQDEIVDFSLGLHARQALTEAGYQVDWHDWMMGHTVCREEISSIRSWIIERLSP